MDIHQHGKSNSIKELLVKIAKREHLEISEVDTTSFSVYASPGWRGGKRSSPAPPMAITVRSGRSTFSSLMLSHGEDPLWVARMLGHTSLDMIFKHCGKFIRNRSRKDGGRFLEGLKEAEVSSIGKDKAGPGRL